MGRDVLNYRVQVLEYLIEGFLVTSGEIREGGYCYGWRCKCPEFERRLVKYGEGFCTHVALALYRAITNNTVYN